MPAAWSKLQAVNRILRAGGEHPVSTLSSTSGVALMAEALLDEVNFEFQSVGLVVNTETFEIEPDEDGVIALPSALLHVDVLVSEDPSDLYIQRGNTPTKLYNVTDQTFVFTDTVTARCVIGIDFNDLPFAIQMAITDETARRYQMQNVGDGQMDQMLREIWIQSRARGRAADIRSRQLNLFGNMRSLLPYEAAKATRRRSGGGWNVRRV